jgi:hypothetical protein
LTIASAAAFPSLPLYKTRARALRLLFRIRLSPASSTFARAAALFSSGRHHCRRRATRHQWVPLILCPFFSFVCEAHPIFKSCHRIALPLPDRAAQVAAAVIFNLRTPTSISTTAASPAPEPSPTRCRGGEQDPLPPFTLPRAVAPASARSRQPRRPLAVRAAVAAGAAF